MDSSETFGTGTPCLLHHRHAHNHHHLFTCPQPLTRRHHYHHHHFHLYVSPHCPLHRDLLQPKACPRSIPLPNQPDLQVPKISETYPSEALAMQEGNEEMIEEEDEDPVFVLTDEWREFFAKSEAKRRSAKKQAKKKGKAFAET